MLRFSVHKVRIKMDHWDVQNVNVQTECAENQWWHISLVLRTNFRYTSLLDMRQMEPGASKWSILK